MAASRFQPFLVEGARVAGIMGVSDLIAQTLIDGTPISEVNLVRTTKFMSIGLFFLGPVLRLWYGHLESIVDKNQPPLHRGLKKMVIDQCIAAPTINPAIITLVNLLNGEKMSVIKERLQRDYVAIMIKNYMLWPAAQTINFSLIPLNYQVVYVQIIATVWNCFLSWKVNQQSK